MHSRPDRVIATLPNRMIVVAQAMPTAPVVSAQIWVKTGSIYEQEHVGAGLSHFLEHLLAGGSTSTRPETESNALLGRMGARVNAATGLDTVHYYINTTSENTSDAVALLSDWIQNNLITQEEFDREREVIQREFSMGDGEPGRIFWKLTQQALYAHQPDHPGRHPTIGYLDEFLSITREEIQDFYRRMYVPNNMVFTVVGDIDPAAVVEQIRQLWAEIPAGELPAVVLPASPELGEGAEPVSVVGYADIRRPRLRLVWPGAELAGAGDYELDVLATILGQGESSRLPREIRDQQRLVTSIQAYNASFSWGRGFFGIDTELAVPLEQQAQAEEAILAQIARLRDERVSDAELQRAKRKTRASVLAANQTAEGVASRVARDLIGLGDPDYLQRYAQAIEAITPEQLQAVARRVLQPEGMIRIGLQPTGPQSPVTSLARPEGDADGPPRGTPLDLDNRRLLQELEGQLTRGDQAITPVVVETPQTFELSHGLRLIVQRSTVVPAVSLQLYWIGGLLRDDHPGREGVANAVTSMMTRGTQRYSATELAEAIEDLGASLSAGTGNNTTFVQAESLAEDFPKILALFSEVLQRPTFSEEEWARLQPRLLAAIDRQQESWFGETNAHFRAAYYGEHPWSQSALGRREVVEALTAEELRAAHTQMLGGMTAVMAVVGDVDPQAVREAVEQELAALKVVTDAGDLPQPTAPAPGVHFHTTQKPITAVQIGLGPGIDRQDPRYAGIQVLARLLSDFPAGWLEQELRGRGPGLVYAASAGASVGLVPGHFSIVFNTGPGQAAEAVQRSFSVVNRARRGEISPDDLARAQAKVLTNEFFGRQSNSSRAAEAALDTLYGVHDPGGLRFQAAVQSLDASALQALAREHLTNPVIVILSKDPVQGAEELTLDQLPLDD